MHEVEQVAFSCQFIYGSRKFGLKLGNGVACVCGFCAAEREHRKMKVLEKETWIWEQIEHPWMCSC